MPVTGEWVGEAEVIPGSLNLPSQELPNHRVLEAVVFCPVNTEVLVLLDQGQDGPEPLGQAEVLLPAALLPGKDSEQLQGVTRGQRGPRGPCGLLRLHLRGARKAWLREEDRAGAHSTPQPEPRAFIHLPQDPAPTLSFFSSACGVSD